MANAAGAEPINLTQGVVFEFDEEYATRDDVFNGELFVYEAVLSGEFPNAEAVLLESDGRGGYQQRHYKLERISDFSRCAKLAEGYWTSIRSRSTPDQTPLSPRWTDHNLVEGLCVAKVRVQATKARYEFKVQASGMPSVVDLSTGGIVARASHFRIADVWAMVGLTRQPQTLWRDGHLIADTVPDGAIIRALTSSSPPMQAAAVEVLQERLVLDDSATGLGMPPRLTEVRPTSRAVGLALAQSGILRPPYPSDEQLPLVLEGAVRAAASAPAAADLLLPLVIRAYDQAPINLGDAVSLVGARDGPKGADTVLTALDPHPDTSHVVSTTNYALLVASSSHPDDIALGYLARFDFRAMKLTASIASPGPAVENAVQAFCRDSEPQRHKLMEVWCAMISVRFGDPAGFAKLIEIVETGDDLATSASLSDPPFVPADLNSGLEALQRASRSQGAAWLLAYELGPTGRSRLVHLLASPEPKAASAALRAVCDLPQNPVNSEPIDSVFAAVMLMRPVQSASLRCDRVSDRTRAP